MTGKHWASIGLFLSGVASTLAALHSWDEAKTPAFVAGVLMQAGGAVFALFSDKPGDPK